MVVVGEICRGVYKWRNSRKSEKDMLRRGIATHFTCFYAQTHSVFSQGVQNYVIANFSSDDLIDDVARVVDHMLKLPKAKAGDGLFNVRGSSSMRVIDMAELIQSRCSKLFDFTPEIICPKKDDNEKNSDLDYRIDKLLNANFTLKGDMTSEIDALLLMCKKNFNRA